MAHTSGMRDGGFEKLLGLEICRTVDEPGWKASDYGVSQTNKFQSTPATPATPAGEAVTERCWSVLLNTVNG